MSATAPLALTPIDAITDESLEHAIATLRARSGELREWGQAWWDAWHAHDAARVTALVHDEIAYRDPSMLGDYLRGTEEFHEFVAMVFRIFPDLVFEQSDWPLYAALDGSGIAVPWRSRCHFTGDMKGGPTPLQLAPTGRPIGVEGVDLYEFRDGLLYRWDSVVNMIEIAEQIGVAPIRRALPILIPIQRALAPLIRRAGNR